MPSNILGVNFCPWHMMVHDEKSQSTLTFISHELPSGCLA
jgi:hypothetical protein